MCLGSVDLLSVAAEEVAGIDLIADVVQAGVIAVGDDGPGFPLEGSEVIDDLAAEEGCAVFQGRFIDDHGGALCLDTLHDALDGGLAEVVRVRLHGEAVDADDDIVFLRLRPGIVGPVGTGDLQDTVRDIILAGAVALDDGGHHILRNIRKVGQELLGILGQAVAAVTEGGVVIVGADPGIQADAADDIPGIQALGFGIGIQLVKIGNTEGQISVCKELHGLSLGEPHEENLRILLEGGSAQHIRKALGLFPGGIVTADDDAAGIEIIIKGLGLPEELRGEEDVRSAVLLTDRGGIADGHGALDDHDGIGIGCQHRFDDGFNGRGIKKVLLGIIVRGGGDDHKIRVRAGAGPVQSGGQVQGFLRKVFFNILVLNRADAMIDLLHLFRNDVHKGDVMEAGKEDGNGKADITGSVNGDVRADGRCGGRLRHIDKGDGRIKGQDVGQTDKLIRGRHIILLFQAAEQGTVDPGPGRQVLLGDIERLPLGKNGSGEFFKGEEFHPCTSVNVIMNNMKCKRRRHGRQH